MKKTLLSIVSLLSFTAMMGQANCASAVTVTLNSTITAPAFTNETGTPPTILCGLANGVGAKGNGTNLPLLKI